LSGCGEVVLVADIRVWLKFQDISSGQIIAIKGLEMTLSHEEIMVEKSSDGLNFPEGKELGAAVKEMVVILPCSIEYTVAT